MTAQSSHAVLPLALVAGSIVLTVAACGGTAGQTPSATSPATGAASSSVSTSTSSTSTASTSTASTSTAASPSTASGPSSGATGGSGSGGCATSSLRITYANDTGGGGAGSVAGALSFTNTGSTACTLTGFPGVSFVSGSNGTQVGQPATRTDQTAKTRTVAPGKSVEAALRRTQPGMYGDDCQQTKVAGFRVYPPGSTEAAFVAFRTTGCKSTSAPLLQVGPVR